MLSHFAKHFPQRINKNYKMLLNRVLLEQQKPTKIQMNRTASVLTPSQQDNQEFNAPSLNFDNLVPNEYKYALEPYNYQDSNRMRSLRPLLMKIYNHWLELPEELVHNIQQLMSLVYETAFMFDDMDDKSEFRRGLPTAYKIFGIPRTQISARMCSFVMIKKLLQDFDKKEILELFTEEFIRYWAATYREVDFRENATCPTLEQYREICTGKMSVVTILPAKIMQLYTNNKVDVTKLSTLIGIHQQWLNDYSVIAEEKMWDSKGYCDDISECKFTLATIHAINSNTPEGRMVFHILKQGTKDISLLRHAYSLLKELGSLDFTLKCMLDLEKEIDEEIDRLGGNLLVPKYMNILKTFKNEEDVQTNFVNRKWATDAC